MSTLFFRNRRLLTLAILLIVVAGVSSYGVLPRAEDPTLAQRAGRVFTFFPGASAARVEALVTEPLEDRLREIEEIRDIISVSRDGVSVVNIELLDEVPRDELSGVWSRVRDKVSDARADLPDGATDPEFDELEITAFSIIAAVTWELDDPVGYNILHRLAESLEDEFRAVPGTSEVELFGEPDEEVRVEVSAARLASLNLTMADVAQAMRRADAKVPAGAVQSAQSNLLIEVAGEVESLDRVREIPLRVGDDGQAVRLGHIATVEKTIAAPPSELALIDGKPAVTVSARMETGQRIDRWAEQARARLAAFEQRLPQGLGLVMVFDQSEYVEARLGDLQTNLLVAMGLVIAVIFFMMGWRSAILVGAALPLASLMVLTGMRALGVPLHQMSVTGLIIALGLLIDNAIVIVDEVRQRLRRGLTPLAAVDDSVRHLAVPLAASTFTTMLSFLPLVLMPGGAGEFVGAIGLSVIMAIVSSFILAMTVVPALTGLLSCFDGDAGDGLLARGISAEWLTRGYRWSLDAIYRRPAWGIAIAAFMPAIGFWQFGNLREQFFPPADRDQLEVQMRLPAHTSVEQTMRTVYAARDLLLAHPRVENVHWVAGTSVPKFYYNMMGGEDGSAYYAQGLVQLDSPEDDTDVVRELQRQLDNSFPQAFSFARQLEQGPPYEAPVALRIYGPDLDTLHRLGADLRAELSTIPDVIHTRATLDDGTPKLWVEVDETEARMAGLDNVGVAEQLRANLSGAVGGSLLEETEELPLRARIAADERGAVDHLATIDLQSRSAGADGLRQVPLNAIGELRLAPERASIARRNGTRVNTVFGHVRAGVLASKVLADLTARLADKQIAPPPGYRFEFGGEQAERDRAVGNLLASVAVLATMMGATLVLAFGSFRVAGILAAVAAQAAGLGIAALALFGFPFGFMAIIGTMGLIGVAINDAIVVLAAIRENPDARAGDPVAVRTVVMRTSRHVVSTTLTTVAGFIPLLVAGGEFWPPLAVAIAGGVVGATLLALYFAPSAYLLVMCPRWRHEPAPVRDHTARERADFAASTAPAV